MTPADCRLFERLGGCTRDCDIKATDDLVAIRIFQHYWQLPLALLAVVEGVDLLLRPVCGALLTFDSARPGVADCSGRCCRAACCSPGCMFISMAAMGLYNSRQRSRLAGLLARVAASVLGGAMVIAVIFYLFPALQHRARRAAAQHARSLSPASVIVRIVFDTLVDEDVFKRRVLVYGAGRRAGSIARLRRRSDRRGFVVVGYVPAEGDEPRAGRRGREDPIRAADLLTLCGTQRIDEIVVAMDDRRRQFPMDQLLECRLEGVEIVELVSFLERETGKVRLDILNPSWMIFSEGFRQGRMHGTLERAVRHGREPRCCWRSPRRSCC